jgi:hypothetical protein
MTMLCFSCFGLLSVQLAQAQQACRAMNSSLNGPYGFAASEAGTTTTATGTTGAPGATSGYSATELGNLLGGIAAGNQFALTGVLNFDGAGNIDATSASGSPLQVVGSYNVNSDCSVSVSLIDLFGTNKTATQLAGIVLGRGSEIDLTTFSSLNSQTSTGTATATAASPQSESRVTIKLVEVLYRSGCSVANLRGLYGFVLNPTQIQTQTSAAGTTTGGTTTEATTVFGYLDFDGAGNVIAQPVSAGSPATSTPYSALVFTGTYTVNSDCSGSISITPLSAASTSTGTTTTASSTNQALTISFVISPPTSNGSASAAGAPTLNLSFSDSDESGGGYAVAQ